MNWRTLRVVLFIFVAVIQLIVAGGAVLRSEATLRSGEVFRFRIQPVDPVDAFRGRYVAIRMAENKAPAAESFELSRREWVFVPLIVDGEGYAGFGPVSLDPPDEGPFLKLLGGGVYSDADEMRWVSLALTPFARYYMDEGLAPKAEAAVWRGPRGQRNASITVRVKNGFGVLEELWIDGVPILQWFEENPDE